MASATIVPASRSQIEFVDLVDYLSDNPVVEPRMFYESPFTDLSPHGPGGIFEPVDVDRLLETIHRRADVA